MDRVRLAFPAQDGRLLPVPWAKTTTPRDAAGTVKLPCNSPDATPNSTACPEAMVAWSSGMPVRAATISSSSTYGKSS